MKWLVILLIVALLGDLIGLFAVYKYFGVKTSIRYVQAELEKRNQVVEDLTGLLDRAYPTKMVFLHHSVGDGILYEGGLRDSLLEIGILVKGATYGDAVGQDTDINHWVPKFQSDMDRILRFKSHPDRYYSDAELNDIVMFKSCYPNSNITSDGTLPGDPNSSEKTLANYKATFVALQEDLRKQPNHLFVYLTSPPLAPSKTTPENARRAREFNTWLLTEYLPQYKETTGLDNLAIFDLFDVLADKDNVLKAEYRTQREGNSHPNAEGSKVAAAAIAAWLRPIWEAWRPDKRS
jgi:hypothetical protein